MSQNLKIFLQNQRTSSKTLLRQIFPFSENWKSIFWTSKFPFFLYSVTLNQDQMSHRNYIKENTHQSENRHTCSQMNYLKIVFSDFGYLMSIRQKTQKRKMTIYRISRHFKIRDGNEKQL